MADINGEDTSIRDALSAALQEASSSPEPAPASSSPQPDPVEGAPDQSAAETEAADRRARDEKGRFAPAADGTQPAETARGAKEPKDAAAPATAQQPATQQAGTEEQSAAPTDKPGNPPPGWSPAAKAAWHNGAIPAEVVRDIAKREQEINAGFRKLQEYRPLDQYVEMARQNNTTLPEALKNYIAAEQLLERNPAEGIRWLAQNYNVDLAQFARNAPPQGQIPQPQNGAPQPQQQYQPAPQIDVAPYISPVMQELEQLKRMVYGDKEAQTQGVVEAFFNDPANRYAENVADQMVTLITSGQAPDLKAAYDTACWMNPEVRAELLKEQRVKEQADQLARARQTATQARAAGRSITGAPATSQSPSPNTDDLRATLEEQFRGYARV
jgi:hypothetical protein